MVLSLKAVVKIAGTLRNMLVRVGADVSGLRQGLKNAQKDVKYFGRNVSGSLKEMRGQIAGLAAGLGGGLLLKGGIQDAMRYEALMTTLGESMGESRKDFEKWAETVGRSMGFSRIQSAETANLLSLNFKKIATSQEDLVDKTTKMMETAAIISNKRGMTMQEVSDRIRSAMNQEADGADELGVNVRIAAVKTSQAYQEMANGQPWDKLSESMRKTILYHHILQQVSENLGSSMQDTTALRMAAFTASLADVKLALGQAFMPILYNVLPLLTKMAQALYRVLQVVAAFMRALFGGGFKYKAPVSKSDVDTTKEQANALGGVGEAAEKAGKKSAKAAKKSKEAWTGLFGFDEVNTIKDPEPATAGGGGGAGGGAGGLGGLGEGLEMPKPDFKPFEQAIDELAKKMERYTKPIKDAFKAAFDFISKYVGEKIAYIKDWWAENGEMILQATKNVWGLVGPIIMTVLTFIWDSVKMVIDGVIQTFTGIVTFLAGIFTGDFKKAWEGLQNIFLGIVQALFGFWNLTFIGGIKKVLLTFIKDGIKSFLKFVDDFKEMFGKGVDHLKDLWWKFLDNLKGWFDDAKDFISGRVELMQTSFKGLWDNVTKWAGDAWAALKNVWGGVVSWFQRTVITPLVDGFENIKDAFSEGIGEGIVWIINKAIDGFNKVLNGFNRLKNKTPIGDLIPDLKIPRLARGGITNGPTLAMVGDNVGGREVISPLDRLQSMLTNSVVQAMQLGNTNNNQRTGDIILNIDGRSFARIVKPFLDNEQSRVGTDVRIRTI